MGNLILRIEESKPRYEISIYLGFSGLLTLEAEKNNKVSLEDMKIPEKLDELDFDIWFSCN